MKTVIIIILTGILFPLILAEFSLRIFPTTDLIYEIKDKSYHCFHEDGIKIIFCKDKDVLLIHPKGFQFHIKTNSLGERIIPLNNSEVYKKISDHTNIKKIIWVIGDSLSMGWGLDVEKTFSYYINNSENYQVRNLAVDSLGSIAIRELIEEKLKNSKSIPNVIIWLFSESDFVDDKKFQILKQNLFKRFVFVIQFYLRKYSYLCSWVFLQFIHKNLDQKNIGEKNHLEKIYFSFTENQVDLLSKSLKNKNIKLLMIFIPTRKNKWQKSFVAKLINNGISVIELKQFDREIWIPNDGHPNGQLNKEIFEKILLKLN